MVNIDEKHDNPSLSARKGVAAADNAAEAAESDALSPELIASVMRECAGGLELTEEQIQKFIIYYDMLVERNRVVNLTRITGPRDAAEKHFADSVLGSSLIKQGARVVDVGTGAGFPGIPLAIVRPDIRLVLIDSLGKRVNFLREVCERLGIAAEAIHARAEDAARAEGLRGGFDCAVSRAVAPMNVLLELTSPFVKVGGVSLMYKGSAAREELSSCENALSVLHCRASLTDFDVPWGARTIVSAEKLAPTPARFPRKAGSIEKAPL